MIRDDADTMRIVHELRRAHKGNRRACRLAEQDNYNERFSMMPIALPTVEDVAEVTARCWRSWSGDPLTPCITVSEGFTEDESTKRHPAAYRLPEELKSR